MAKLSALKLDSKRAQDGVWFRDPWGLGLRFRVASIQSAPFRKAMQSALRMADLPDAPSTKDDQATLRVVAEHLLLDVDGLEDDSGEPLKYSTDMGVRWGQDPEMQHVIEWVLEKARSLGSFLGKTRDDAGKD